MLVTKNQYNHLKTLREYLVSIKWKPVVSDLATEMGVTPQAAHAILSGLDKIGAIRRAKDGNIFIMHNDFKVED